MAAGAGLAQARWVPNRGILLLLYADSLMVYDTELGTALERVALPRRYRPFKRWLAVEGGGACLGNAEEGALSTLVVEHEVRACRAYVFFELVIPLCGACSGVESIPHALFRCACTRKPARSQHFVTVDVWRRARVSRRAGRRRQRVA